jgi:hypothetical protein
MPDLTFWGDWLVEVIRVFWMVVAAGAALQAVRVADRWLNQHRTKNTDGLLASFLSEYFLCVEYLQSARISQFYSTVNAVFSDDSNLRKMIFEQLQGFLEVVRSKKIDEQLAKLQLITFQLEAELAADIDKIEHLQTQIDLYRREMIQSGEMLLNYFSDFRLPTNSQIQKRQIEIVFVPLKELNGKEVSLPTDSFEEKLSVLRRAAQRSVQKLREKF